MSIYFQEFCQATNNEVKFERKKGRITEETFLKMIFF